LTRIVKTSIAVFLRIIFQVNRYRVQSMHNCFMSDKQSHRLSHIKDLPMTHVLMKKFF